MVKLIFLCNFNNCYYKHFTMWILCVFFNNTYCLLFLYYLLNVFSFFISINKIIWIMNEILFKICCVLTIYRYSVDTVTSQRTPWCLHASSLNLSLPLHRKDMSYLTAPTYSNSIVEYLTALQRRPHFVYTSCLSVRTQCMFKVCAIESCTMQINRDNEGVTALLSRCRQLLRVLYFAWT